VAGEGVDAVRAVATLMTSLHGAVVNVQFTVDAREPRFTDTRVVIDVIEA